MEGYCSTGQSPLRAVVPMEGEELYYILYYIILYRVNFRTYAASEIPYIKTQSVYLRAQILCNLTVYFFLLDSFTPHVRF